ncbi:MAG: DUF423 domain-containing protein [Cyanobacteria bacterium J083]|nr:MAG: DUF423 domain-containing protein [Cyanobacteria bacterium J083]
MMRIFLVIAAIFGASSVAAGAFASHALKSTLSAQALTTFETGARYQMYHALALLITSLLLTQSPNTQNYLIVASWAFIIGILLFSGSLYILSLTGIKWLGAITPLGGVSFLLGWLALLLAAWHLKL